VRNGDAGLRREADRRGRRQEPKEGPCLGSESRLLGCLGPERGSTVVAVVTPERAEIAQDRRDQLSTGKAGIAIEHTAKDRNRRALAKGGSPASWGGDSRTFRRREIAPLAELAGASVLRRSL
jgi:hypothetical protein